MSANLFICCWIFGGLLNVPILALLRKRFNRERNLCLLDEILTCIKYGPLLSIGIFLASLKISEEEKKRKFFREESLKLEELKIKSRFEILDL